MKLNPEKTKYSKDVILELIKKDKLDLKQNYKCSENIQDELLNIRQFADKHPNSGSLMKLLIEFFNRIIEEKQALQNINVLISIIVDIAYKNPRTYPIISATLSKFLDLLNEKDKMEVFEKIRNKMKKVPNTEYLDLWLQRISLKFDKLIEYNGSLSKKVNEEVKIWETEWMKNNYLKEIFRDNNIIDSQEIKDMDNVISKEEVELFKTNKYYPY